MSFKTIPEHKAYYCDFFCNPDGAPIEVPVSTLHGLKMKSGGGRNYPVLLDPANENAAMHICMDCLSSFAALYQQVQNRKESMKNLLPNEELVLKTDKRKV